MPADPVVRLLHPQRLSPAVEAAWRELAERAAEPNPCNEPDMLLPAVRHLPGGDRVRLLVVTRGDRLDACLPVVPASRWRNRVPVPALVSWTHDFQVLGTPLVAEDRAVETLVTLLGTPVRSRRGAMLLEVQDLGDEGPVAGALDEAATRLGACLLRWESFERAMLTRTPSGAVVGEERRDRRRRSRRGLERAAGPLTSVNRAADPDGTDRFLAMEADGWKGREGTAIACDASQVAFFRELCARFAQAGRLELRSLDGRSGPVAMSVAVHAGGGTFHLKTAYDEQYGAFSPGVLLLVDWADRFATDGVRFRDVCVGSASEMEGRAWPGRRKISTVVTSFAGPASRALVGALVTARHLRHRRA